MEIENINHPSHYNSSCFEVIDFIEIFNLDFCLGNAVKYICRAGKKNPNTLVEDLGKAKWYLEEEKRFLSFIKEKEFEPYKAMPLSYAYKITGIFCEGQNFKINGSSPIYNIINSIFENGYYYKESWIKAAIKNLEDIIDKIGE
jgi:hypothetical protein